MKNVKEVLICVLFLGLGNLTYGQKGAEKEKDEIQISSEIKDLEELSLEELLNVEITVASKSKERLMDAPGIVSVISRDELKRFGGTTLSDILERVPGLATSTSYFSDRSIISARGDQIKVTGSHILFLIDGRPIREILEGGISSDLLETFPVNIIERIEVIKGPGSVLYGNNAFSGVINIITQRDTKKGVSLSGLAGNGGSLGGNSDFGVQSSGLSVVGAVRYLKKADWDVKYVHSPSPGTTTTYDVTIPNHGASAFLSLDYKGLKLTSSYNQWETQNFVRGNLGQTKWNKFYTNLGYGMEVNDNWNMDFNLSITPAKLKTVGYPFIERTSNDMVAEWTNFVSLGEKSKLIFGGVFNKIKGQEVYLATEPSTTISDEEKFNLGIYAQLNYAVLDNLKFIGGLQANKVENVDLDIVPRAGLIWYPVSSLNVKAIYSQAFRAASINELGLMHPALTGNLDLVPEKVGNFDLSVSYQGDQFQVRANYFISNQTNIIVPDRSVVPGIYRNTGEFNIQGVELEGKYYINNEILFTASTLYQSNEDQDGNKNVSPVANFGAKAGISYQGYNGVTVSLFNVYQGSLDERFDAILNPNPDAYNKLSLYCAFDLVNLLDLDFGQSLSVYVQGDNILGDDIWMPDLGGIAGETIPVYPGKMLYAGVKVAF